MANVDLGRFDLRGYRPGASVLKRVLWYAVNAFVFHSWTLPFYAPKRGLLKWFGAKVGDRVVIKPRVTIKHPWRLCLGDHVWIGEGVWIDNLAEVSIGSHVCVSQDAYLLTGNHDYKDHRFGLITQGITIEDGAWVGARSVICPGVRVASGSVLAAGSVLTRSTIVDGIYAGNPAQWVRDRHVGGNVDGDHHLR